MIGYTTVGAKDLDQSLSFYDRVLGVLGGERKFPMGGKDRGYIYAGGEGAMLGVCKPYDEGEASAGNGTMVALSCPDRETVNKVYETAIEAGAAGEGDPGERMPTFYGAYFRDPTGNKICAFKMG